MASACPIIIWAAKGRRVELMPNKRPDWCPLVAVPDHGRLIEAEELRWVFEKNFGDDTFSFQIIDAAPTIIPADKEGDGKISYSHFKGSNLCPLEAKND